MKLPESINPRCFGLMAGEEVGVCLLLLIQKPFALNKRLLVYVT